jgi:hypothetical protein
MWLAMAALPPLPTKISCGRRREIPLRAEICRGFQICGFFQELAAADVNSIDPKRD